MDYKKRLRPYLGESAHLVEMKKESKTRHYVLDFSKTKHGQEVTLIEVGEHAVIIEFVLSGHKSVLTFDEIQIEESRLKPLPSHS